MLKRTSAIAALVLAICAGVPAAAQTFGQQTVPVNVQGPAPQGGTAPASGAAPCNPAPGSVQGCYQAPVGPVGPAAATPAPVPVAPNTAIPQGFFAGLETGTLDRIQRVFDAAINASVALGGRIFITIAFISFLVAAMRAVIGEDSIDSFVRMTYWRLVESSLWLGFIQWTWVGPGGMDGWFPLIIGGLAAIGAQIANGTVGTNIVTFSHTNFHFTILPGSILDLGSALFGAISKLAFTQVAGTPSNLPGLLGTAVNGAQTAIAVISGALTGTLMINIVIYVLMMLAGLYAYCVCAWVSFRYFMATIKIFAIACLSLIQGFAGSRRLSGYAGGFLSQAIIVGLDFFLSTVLVGIFYGLIIGIIQNTALWPLVANVLAIAGGPVLGVGVAVVHTGISLGMLLLIDVSLTLWAYLMASVPKLVGDTLNGRLDVSAREAVQTFRSSPTIGGQIMGGAGRALQGAAERGPVQAAWNQGQRLGGFAFAGASSPMRGAPGLVDGALRGAAVGGVSGAAAGLAGSWVAGKFVRAAPTSGTASPGDQTTTGAADGAASSAARSRAAAASDPSTADAEAGEAPPPEPQHPSDASVRRTVTIEDDFVEDGDPNDTSMPATARATATPSVNAPAQVESGPPNATPVSPAGSAASTVQKAGGASTNASSSQPDYGGKTIPGAVEGWFASRGGLAKAASSALDSASGDLSVGSSVKRGLMYSSNRERTPNAFPESTAAGSGTLPRLDLRGK